MGFFSDLFGGSGKKAARQASQAQIEGFQKGIEELRRQFGITQENLQPFLNFGQGQIGAVEEGTTVEGLDARLGRIFDSETFGRLASNGEVSMALMRDLSSVAWRRRLIERRQLALGLLGKLRETRKRRLIEDRDLVTDREIAAQIRATERRLTELDEALERLEMGTYGVCGVCGAGISLDRLDALPSTGSCRRCA